MSLPDSVRRWLNASRPTSEPVEPDRAVKDLPERIYVRWAYTDGWWLRALTQEQMDEPGKPCAEYELKRVVTPKITRTVVFE